MKANFCRVDMPTYSNQMIDETGIDSKFYSFDDFDISMKGKYISK